VDYLTDQRDQLGAVLVGSTMTLADSRESVKAFPALVLGPAAPWLDGRIIPTGPGRPFVVSLTGTLFVAAADADVGQRAMERAVQEVLERLPATWRFDGGERPYPARAGELAALACELLFSLTSSVS
jgi:hypothetical protein